MTKFRDLPSTVVGQLGELIVAREYRRDGWGVIASYKFSGANDDEAPAIEIDDGAHEITPDLDVSKGGKRIWIEVKTHAIAAKNKKLSTEQRRDVFLHGVPVRLFDNYVAVEERSGNPVFLAIVQLDTREILISPKPLSQMFKIGCMCGCRSVNAQRCTAGAPSKYPQWYWDKTDFEVRGHVDDKTFKLLDEKHRAFKDGHAIRRHGIERESHKLGIFDSRQPSRTSDWTWACLVCDATGTGDSSDHRCVEPILFAGSRAYWQYRIGRVATGMTDAQVAELVAKPIDRDVMAKLLGPTWYPAGDAR